MVNLQVPGIPLNMAFHSYDQHVFIANDSDVVRFASFYQVLFHWC